MTGSRSALLKIRRPIEATAAPMERRRSVRHTTVFQVAKLCNGQSEELCVLRDISDTGLRAEVYSAVAPGSQVSFEMRTGHRVMGRVVWSREATIGVEFNQPVSVPELLAHCSFDDRLGRMRPPRVDVQIPALLMIDRHLVDITIRNISQAGLKVACDEVLEADSEVTVRFTGLGQREATVRWYRDGHGGLQLTHSLTYPEFAAWRVGCLREAAANN